MLGPLLAALLAAPPPDLDAVRLVGVEARLIYEDTGRLSSDVLARSPKFEGWNTIIGEGDAEESAQDLLIFVKLESAAPGALAEWPLDVAVRDAEGRILAARRWDFVTTSRQGSRALPIFVQDVGCAGQLQIEASFDRRKVVDTITLDCGE